MANEFYYDMPKNKFKVKYLFFLNSFCLCDYTSNTKSEVLLHLPTRRSVSLANVTCLLQNCISLYLICLTYGCVHAHSLVEENCEAIFSSTECNIGYKFIFVNIDFSLAEIFFAKIFF